MRISGEGFYIQSIGRQEASGPELMADSTTVFQLCKTIE
jgi:hypothetical protein